MQESAENSLKNSEINIDMSNEEKIISSHFIEYIEDERIFTLPINFLDRVMKTYLRENKQIFEDEITKQKIYNFLLRCLKKYKKPASVLFLNINFDKLDRNLIINLHNDFADFFDFNMINVKSLFDATYDLISENSKILSLIKDISEKQESQMKEFNEYKLSIEKELKEIRNEQEKIGEYRMNEDQNKEQISSRIKILEDNQSISSKKIQEFENKSTQFEEKIRNIDEKQRNLPERIQTLENKKNEIEMKIRNIDDKQNNSSDRIQTLENKQRTTESQLSQQMQKQQTMQSSINNISDKVTECATRRISFIIQSNFYYHFM